MILSLLILPHLATAGLFEQRTSMGPWPERQVEREYALPKGWFQIGLAADTKLSTGYRDETGAFTAYTNGTVWQYSTGTLEIDQGFSRRIHLYARVPEVQASVRNDHGTDTSTLALGDVHTGFYVQPWLGHPTVAAFRLDVKAPSGCEWPANSIGGPTDTSSFLTGTGITNLGAFFHGSWRIGRILRVEEQVGYVFKFPGVVGYVLQTDGWGYGWLNPGNELVDRLDVTGQLTDDLALTGWARWSSRGTYEMGTKGPGLKLENMEPMDGTAGDFTDVGATLSWEPQSHLEFAARVATQLFGDDTRTFAALGLEEYSPQPGVTYGLTGVVRW